MPVALPAMRASPSTSCLMCPMGTDQSPASVGGSDAAGICHFRMSKKIQSGTLNCSILTKSPHGLWHPSVTESTTLPPNPSGRRHVVSSTTPTRANQRPYGLQPDQLIELRRQMLRFARSTPIGALRNERRQIARSLRSLFKNKEWLHAHTAEGLE